MTTNHSLAAAAASVPARSPRPALRPVGVGFVLAGTLWAIGDVIEISFSRTDAVSDGWSFWVSELFFYASMTVFAVSAILGIRRGLVGRSVVGRIGLITMAVAYVQYHWKFDFGQGFLPAVNHGELAVVYAFVFLFIAARGAGAASLDGRREPRSFD